MKVLFVSNDPTIFDETSESRARMHAYAGAIGELHIISAAKPDAREKQEGNLLLHPVHVWKLLRVPVLAYRARRLIRKYDIEVVSAQDPFEHGLAAYLAVRGTEAKLHVQVHTDFFSPWFAKTNDTGRLMTFLNTYRRMLADLVLPAAAGIRVVSERIKTSLVDLYGSDILEPTVIPVMVDSAVPAPVPLPSHPFTFALIAVGRLEPEKRIGDILIALKLVVMKYPMICLYLLGEGRERKHLEDMVHNLEFTDRVFFLGDRPDARGLMGSAQAFIQASAYEGYGRTLVEAALAKIPIITTDVGIVGEVFKNHQDVLVAPIANPVALAHSIVELIESSAVREALPRHAEVVAHNHLTAGGAIPDRIFADLAHASLQRHEIHLASRGVKEQP